MYEYIFSADLGRFQDFSCLHLLKVVPANRKEDRTLIRQKYQAVYQYRTTERYTQLAARVDRIMEQDLLRDRTALLIDGNNIGSAVAEMFKHHPIVIMTHGGDAVSVRDDPPGYNVPKRDLVAALQVVFQTGRIEIAKDLPYNEQLVKELQNFLMTVSGKGNDLYANLKDSIHDDMVLSLAIGLWYGEKFIKFELKPVSGVAESYDPLSSVR